MAADRERTAEGPVGAAGAPGAPVPARDADAWLAGVTCVGVAPGVFRLRIPQPIYHATTVYLLTGAEPVLIDTGHPASLPALERALGLCGYRLADLGPVLYTNTHFDHMGGGAALGARHALYDIAHADCVDTVAAYGDYTHSILGAKPVRARLALAEGGAAFGAAWDAHDAEYVRGSDLPGPLALHVDRGVRDGERLRVGRWRLEAVETPGRCPFHVSYFEPERRLLFCGDLVLAGGTPLIRAMGDDVDTYLASLGRAEALGPSLMLPGHGAVHSDPAAALADARGRVRAVQAAVVERLTTRSATLAELAEVVMRTLPQGIGSSFSLAAGVAETHLHRLLRDGVAAPDANRPGAFCIV